jgi:hypothetical protein
MLKFFFDIGMVTLFIVLVTFFSRQRDKQKLKARLTMSAKSRLKRESVITTVFVMFYIVRVLVMDLGYSWLVIKYYKDSKDPDHQWEPEDILEGEKSYIFIALYTLDFLICMALLALFYMYSRKSTEDEERLKNYFLMTIKDQDINWSSDGHPTTSSGAAGSKGLAGLAGKRELDNESFLRALHSENNKMSNRDYTQIINKKLLAKTLQKWEKQNSKLSSGTALQHQLSGIVPGHSGQTASTNLFLPGNPMAHATTNELYMR